MLIKIVNYVTITFIYYLYFIIKFGHLYKIDYYSEEFDPLKNCKNKGQLITLRLDNEDQCISLTEHATNPNHWLQNCASHLTSYISAKCGFLGVKHSGDLSYCNQRGSSICCFENYSCISFAYHSTKFLEKATQYLNDTNTYLKEHNVKGLGYKSCHHLDDYNTTACAKDCEKYAESQFAKNCTENSGFFKCCIRRDAHCDRCKFCCTLPMCRNRDNTTTYETESLNKEEKSAIEIYQTDKRIYKSENNQCLKPHSHEDPNKWRSYDRSEFREASNKNQLSKVYSFSFNKNRFSFFDQSVLSKFTSRNGYKLLKKLYGFDYCSGKNTIKAFPKVGGLNTNCILKCEKAENGKFAKKCRNQNGVFKCCQIWLTLHRFSDVNKNLGFSNNNHCRKENLYKYCDYCCITLMCTKKDKRSGKIVNKLKTKMPRYQTVGGDPAVGYGMRMMSCLEMDMCNSMKTWLYYKLPIAYKNAFTPEEICHLGLQDVYGTRNTSISELSYKKIIRCLKNKKRAEINVKICPTYKLREQEETNAFIKFNKKLAKLRKNRRKKYKKGKCKKKKNKKKKCKKKKSLRRKKLHKNTKSARRSLKASLLKFIKVQHQRN